MVKINPYYAGMSLGVVLVSGGILYILLNKALSIINRLKKSDKYRILTGIAKNQKIKSEDKKAVIYALLGGGSLYLLTYNLLLFFLGLALGVVGYKVSVGLKRDHLFNLKRKEVGVFFEAVEFYIKMGMNIPQAMYLAKMLVPHLEKNILKCISLWPKNPQKALEIFREDLDIPEAEILISLLQRIEKSGLTNMEGIIQREARNIEKLREVAAKSQISMRPVYFMVYRMLPLVASMSIFIGSLIYRLTINFQSMGIKF